MARKPIPKATETAVLIRARRRCCICFGLNRDTRMMSGQIAHLDKNNANSAEDNLAFLCFAHHDEYDSISSQRKNLTIGEVKAFREELSRTINVAFTQQVHFGSITTPPTDPFAGTWIRLGTGANSAELKLTPLPDSFDGDVQYYVSGHALWGPERPNGPNFGTLEFLGIVTSERKLAYRRSLFGSEFTTTLLTFSGPDKLAVSEDNWIGAYGMNVTFEGDYQRAG
ncbi:hypothetical protein DM806_03215 [Sphingobium lactosutens]|uniref:hypothetical protein n=1 Tax=Sphingobium lactosutens TaxID=522773 RepID=UPI0015B95C5E|nr:hypothetical protein [Sphingobium lactosutens]NWK94690.1 hypothetical protein [Sphingobium lactosutens]